MSVETDIIEIIESIAAKSGLVADIDSDYYEDFMKLSLMGLEQLVTLLIFAREKSIRQRQMDNPRMDQVVPTAKNIQGILFLMSRGHLQINVYGQLRFVAIGKALPSPEMAVRLDSFLKESDPFVQSTVELVLPWFLSREKPQPKLPL